MVGVLLSACSSRHQPRPSGLGPTEAATGVVLPGGAAAQPPAGSPPVCFALAQSVAIRGSGRGPASGTGGGPVPDGLHTGYRASPLRARRLRGRIGSLAAQPA